MKDKTDAELEGLIGQGSEMAKREKRKREIKAMKTDKEKIDAILDLMW